MARHVFMAHNVQCFPSEKNMLPAQSKFFKSSQLNRESDRTIIATFEVVIMRRLPLECIRVCA